MGKKTQNGQSNLGKKCGTGGINLSDFRLYYQARVIKTLWYRPKNRNREQWTKTPIIPKKRSQTQMQTHDPVFMKS